MALAAVQRIIQIKKGTVTVDLHEPTPGASIEQLRQFNMAEHPELATCGVDQDEVDGQPRIIFKPQAGTRG